MRIGIRGIKFSKSEIVKSANKDFKNIFHSINRSKETFRSTSLKKEYNVLSQN